MLSTDFNPTNLRGNERKGKPLATKQLVLNKVLISSIEKLFDCKVFLMEKGTKCLLNYLLNIVRKR